MELLIKTLTDIWYFLLNAMCLITTGIIVIGFIYIFEKSYSMQKQEEEQNRKR